MINQQSLQSVAASAFTEHFCKPLYESYSFSRVPGTIQKLLTQKTGLGTLPADTVGDLTQEYEEIVLLFIDGFGWRFFEKYRERYPFLKRILDEGIASKITSQFPSTTANHVTCMNTGLEVGESGIYEWFYYEPELDRMIAPLLFSFAGDKAPATLLHAGVSPKQLYPFRTFYQDLKEVGVASYSLQHDSIVHSPYSQTMFQGAQQISFKHMQEALEQLVRLLAEQKSQKAYFHFYWGEIDAMGHRYGIDSPQFEDAVEQCFKELEEFFWQKKVRSGKKSACILIADHGMISVDPKKTFYLNEELPSLLQFIKRNRQGDLIAPAGSCRDFFLHIKEEALERVRIQLTQRLQGKAAVYLTEELIKQHFFGSKPPSKNFLDRVGNLVILPYEGEGVWWREKHRFDQHFYGAHGGLTRGEMETIFLFLPF